MTTLKSIQGVNEYCGPAVLAALTGRTTDECASVISRINGRKEIKSVHMSDLILALERMRFTVEKQLVYTSRLFGTLSLLSERGDAKYVILVPRHVVAVEVHERKVYLIDNHTKAPIDAAGSARLTQTVEGIYKVVERPQPVFVRYEIRVVERNGLIDIQRVSIFENEEDNIVENKGRLYYRDIEELKEIINKLAKIGQIV